MTAPTLPAFLIASSPNPVGQVDYHLWKAERHCSQLLIESKTGYVPYARDGTTPYYPPIPRAQMYPTSNLAMSMAAVRFGRPTFS